MRRESRISYFRVCYSRDAILASVIPASGTSRDAILASVTPASAILATRTPASHFLKPRLPVHFLSPHIYIILWRVRKSTGFQTFRLFRDLGELSRFSLDPLLY